MKNILLISDIIYIVQRKIPEVCIENKTECIIKTNGIIDGLIEKRTIKITYIDILRYLGGDWSIDGDGVLWKDDEEFMLEFDLSKPLIEQDKEDLEKLLNFLKGYND